MAVTVVRDSFGACLCKQESLIKKMHASLCTYNFQYITCPGHHLQFVVSKEGVMIGIYDAHKVFMKTSNLIKREQLSDTTARKAAMGSLTPDNTSYEPSS